MILTKRNKEEMTLLINVQSLGLHIVYESFQAVYKKLMEEVEQVIKARWKIFNYSPACCKLCNRVWEKDLFPLW